MRNRGRPLTPAEGRARRGARVRASTRGELADILPVVGAAFGRGTRSRLASLALVLFSALSLNQVLVAQPASETGARGRVVSLVPAVTEMLFAIGAGPQVVGVSSFDQHPPEVATRARVGALIDPDLERIFALRPTLVVIYGSQVELRHQLSRAGIEAFDYRHGGLGDVFDTIRRLGAATGRAEAAKTLAAALERRIEAVRERVKDRPRPRTLLVFGREPGALRNIYASGGRGVLHDMLEAAGGTNVFSDVDREAVQATSETILARRPEVIIELRTTALTAPRAEAIERTAWSALSAVPAVRDGRVHLLSGDDLVVPGPRVAGAVERLARALHAGE
jgi:iron complex transport system substrate-binding protein